MWFGILGPVEARRTDGSPVDLGGPKVRALLSLLLVDAGQIVSADRLIDGIYGDAPPDGTANALQSQVSRLRRQLGAEGGMVERHAAGYRLAVDGHEVDAREFERLAEAGRLALAAGDHRGAARRLDEALALWRGPALTDLGDTPAARTQVARLDELWLAATEDRVEAALGLGEARELVPRLRELVAAHPLRERVRSQLVRALAGSGRQAEALVAFEDARRTLAEELGADPSAELTQAYLAVLRGEQPTGTVSALPAQLTSFVGRAEELDRVAALLGTERLVTLTGPGGTGKTRLAIECAARLDSAVCLVELAPLADAADVPQAVLAALGLREAALTHTTPADAPPDPVERLVAALADRPMLLVLDNCEHLIDAAATLTARLLAACPPLRVLATSREPLGITGEALCPVPTLAVPAPDVGLDEALDCPAVRLFADRATAGRADFAVDGTTLDAAVRICRALDGLPLAIELAAARVRSLPVHEVAARLDRRFDLLSKGSRAAEARHRTLRAVVAWSWDLLEDEEQVLARRLTVFAGGASLAAAQRVSGLDDTVDLIAGLVDKSLVEIGGGRYRMLETIREFGAERLGEAGETDRLRRAHAEQFLELATLAGPHLCAAEQLEWLARLDLEYDNLVAALRWATRADLSMALRLVGPLSTYWWMRGRRSDGAMLCGDIATRIGTEPPDGLHEEYALCVFTCVAGGIDVGLLAAELDVAESLARAAPWPPRHPMLNVLWAMATGPPTEDDDRRDLLTHDLTEADPWTQLLASVGLGLHQLFHGDADDAEVSLAIALRRSRAIGERWAMATALDHLAQLIAWRGDTSGALAHYDEAIELADQLGATDDVAELHARRADCLVLAGDLAGARTGYERSAGLARRVGALGTFAVALLGLGEIARHRDDRVEARRMYLRAMDECPVSGFGAGEVRLRLSIALGRLAVADGNTGEAVDLIRAALESALTTQNAHVAAGAVEALAGVAALEGDGELAARLLGAGLAIRGARVSGDPDVTGVTSAVRGRIGAAAFDAAYARGRATRTHEVLTIAGATSSASGA